MCDMITNFIKFMYIHNFKIYCYNLYRINEHGGSDMVRRLWKAILCVLLSTSLSACSENNANKMYIQEAQLTTEEQSTIELLGLNQKYYLYDFKLDNSVKSIQINTYELFNGEWHIVSGGGGQSFEGSEGRFALKFDNLANGLSVTVQSEDNLGSTLWSYQKDYGTDFTDMSCTTSALSNKKEIAYDQEIPLVIQIATSKNEIQTYTVDYFFEPQEFEKFDYEHVYAVTILFSKKTVNELDQANQ